MSRGHWLDCSERALVVAKVVVHIPCGEARALKPRRQLERFVQKRELRLRRLRDQPFDVLLERSDRRMASFELHRCRGRPRHEAHRHSIVDIEDVCKRPALNDLGPGMTSIEQHRLDANGERVAGQRKVADDDLRRAHDLTDPDDRGVTEPGDGRHAKQIERMQPFVAPHDRQAKSEQTVGQDHRRPFPEPIASRLPGGGFERHDQHTRRRGWGGVLCRRCRHDPDAVQKDDGPGRYRDRGPSPGHAARPGVGLTVTDMAHRVAPVARHSSITTSASRLKLDISRRSADA